MSKPAALILRAPGTNCDEETARAWELAGAAPEVWHVNRLIERAGELDRFRILTIPGGFSHGDDLGGGRVFAVRLKSLLGDFLPRFRDRGGLILGICNGFQVLVRAGLLPGGGVSATLTHNDSGRYETRWVRLRVRGVRGPWFEGLDGRIVEFPSAHGEGKFLTADPSSIRALLDADRVPVRYADERGEPTEVYPDNPNGSPEGVAGVCDETGRVFGLMPHPERYVEHYHHPEWTRRDPAEEPHGLRLFRNAVRSLA